MFKIFKRKKLNKKKKMFKDADELFSSGKIFTASNDELENTMKELSTKPVYNKIVRHREIIRAFTILTIKNNRYAEKIQFFNFILSILLLVFSAITINIALKQNEYTEVATREVRINQAKSMKLAYEYCLNNPDSIAPNIFGTKSGKSILCTTVLNSSQFDIYKN